MYVALWAYSMLDLEYVRESACVWVPMTLGYIGGRLSDIHITYFCTDGSITDWTLVNNNIIQQLNRTEQ